MAFTRPTPTGRGRWSGSTWQLKTGEFVSLLGPSGCGKTTLLRIIAGFETPTGGGCESTDTTSRICRRIDARSGMVFQNYALFPNLTVAGNIGFGMTVTGASRKEIDARVHELLEMIHLPGYAGRYPNQLSGGQQQRVALARALAVRPRLLLLDEPLSALDAQIRQSLRQEIRAIQQQLRITTVYVTHDQDEALSLSDRVVVMNRGLIEQIGTPADIYHRPRTLFVGTFVGSLNVLGATVVDPSTGSFRVMDQLVCLGPDLGAGRVSNESVLIACRPEQVTLIDRINPPDEGPVLEGIVDDVTFLGSVVRVRLRRGDEVVQLDAVSDRRQAPAVRGERRGFRFPPDACVVLDAP